jgi:protein TonB
MVAPHRPHHSRNNASRGTKNFWATPVTARSPRIPAYQQPFKRQSSRPGTGSWLASGGLHAVIALFLLGLPRPDFPAEPLPSPKPIEVIEVEFVEIPTKNPDKTAAAPPPPSPAETKAPDAPPKPVNKPKPVAQAPKKPTAPRVAPKPQPRPVRQPRRPPEVPVQRVPSQQELAKLAAARLKGRETDVSDRLAALRDGASQSEDDASANQPQKGTPSVSKQLPQGELSGRGVLRAPTPEYPAEAQRKIWEGTTQVMVYVNPDGTVQDTTIVGSSGFPLLDAAAKRAAAKYRFTPLAEGEGNIQRGVIPFFFVIR